ncbi:MAG: hypothetical protein EOP49_12500 [Sphingobacteriales bacterium]|nr:MAG: hypothetical protein EOP49_12500 [Sphingobacteriales bacterium]
MIGQTGASGNKGLQHANSRFPPGKKDDRFLLTWPPVLPGGKKVVTDNAAGLLTRPANANISEGVLIATTPPVIDFLYLPGQVYPGKLWSVWGDGSVYGSKYYTSIGDHDSPRGEAHVYEYDAKTKSVRLLTNIKKFLEEPGRMPPGMDYTPGKIHGRVDRGSDGWLYFSTHRGSTNDNTTDARGYKGDHIYRTNPANGKTEIVAVFPMLKHTIPASVLDPTRMIFYGGTNPGNDAPEKEPWFIAYDVKNKKLLKKVPGGFDRFAILSSSTGCVYWNGITKPGGTDAGTRNGYKYDPATNKISLVADVPVVRACTEETKNGIVYGFTQDNTNLWAFDTRKEKLSTIGPAMVGIHSYVTSVDLDPVTERYLYYVPGAHGGADVDGTPVVQYDLKTKTRKVIAFLSEFYREKYQYTPDGTFSTAISADGSMLYVTWNGFRVSPAKGWNTTAIMAISIPKSERLP